MRIPRRFARQLFALIMSFVMALIVTGFVTWVNTGMDRGFAARWMFSFITAWPVAMTCVLIFENRVRALVAKLTAQ